MSAQSDDNILNLCIDICAEFERTTGIKTKDTHEGSQKELAEKTGLTIQNIKKWHDASRAANEIVAKLGKERS